MKRRHARKRRSPASIRRMRVRTLLHRLARAMPFASYLPVTIDRARMDAALASPLTPVPPGLSRQELHAFIMATAAKASAAGATP